MTFGEERMKGDLKGKHIHKHECSRCHHFTVITICDDLYKRALELACTPKQRRARARIYDPEYWVEKAEKSIMPSRAQLPSD